MTPSRTRLALEGLAQPLRRRSLAGWLLGAGALASVVLAVVAWSLRTAVLVTPVGVLASWGVILVAVPALGMLALRERGRLAARALAERLEQEGTHRRGALTAFLEPQASGTSDALAVAADAAAAESLQGGGMVPLNSLSRRLQRRAVLMVTVLGVGLTALASAGPTHPRVASLWSPERALEFLMAPVRLAADRAAVDRGGTVTLRLEATGHRTATLWQRAPGEPWTSAGVVLDTAGRASLEVGPVETDLYFRLGAGRRMSDTLAVRVRQPAFVGAIRLRAVYPEYLNLEAEPVAVTPDTLLLPAGTVLEVEGEASTVLSLASWDREGQATPLRVSGRQFAGGVPADVTGLYRLRLLTSDGTPVEGESVTLAVMVVPDLPPVVEVPVPGADTLAPADLKLRLVVDARDDHGLNRLELVSRTRAAGSEVVAVLPLPSATSDRVLVETILDLSARGLAAGDTARYFVRAVDNNPVPRSGRSQEFAVVLPSGAEEREARREATADVRRQLDSVLAASRRLERQTEDLAQERARARDAARDPALGFEDARRAEAVAQGQEALLREAESLQQGLEALRESAERGETPDSALVSRLAEISEQLNRALSPELRRRLEELRRALQDLDPQATREALQQLADVQQTLREALERSRDLFQRAALEGELATLAADAEDLAAAQREWNRQVASSDSNAAAAAERELARRADSLAAALERAAGSLESPASREAMQQATQQARQGARQMQAASTAAARGQRQDARSQGEDAAARMEAVSQETADLRERQQDQWRQEVLDALDRAMAETAELSRQQLAVNEAFLKGTDVAGARGRQALVEESVQKLISQVTSVSGKNALVPPQIAVALAVARRQMATAREAVSTGSPNLREAGEASGEAVDALAVAVYQMIRARDDVSGSSSGSGLAEAMERMTQLARQQGQVSQQAGSLLPMMGASGFQQQLQALADQQRSLAREMERIRAGGQLPGARDLGQEAAELAARLEAGRLDRETVARQERLFRRMLDAGRTLQGEEQDDQKERQSTTARPGELALPPASRRSGGAAGPRVPTWDQLQALSPEERRLVIEYFRKLATGGVP